MITPTKKVKMLIAGRNNGEHVSIRVSDLKVLVRRSERLGELLRAIDDIAGSEAK